MKKSDTKEQKQKMEQVQVTTVLSLFDGISCAQVALRAANISFDTFVSVEIETNARSITRANFPNTIHLQDVCLVSYKDGKLYYDGKEVMPLDPSRTIVSGGSPCQGFSNAGKKMNFDDKRSKLYFEFERIVKEIDPKAWLLENVRMKSEWVNFISERLGRPAVMINSKFFTPLSRPRIYWFSWELPKKTIPTVQKTMEGYFDSINNVAKFKVVLSEKALNRCRAIVKRAEQRGLGYTMPLVTKDSYYLCLDKNIFKGADGKRGIIDDGVNPLRMPTPIECERLQGLPDDYTRFDENGKEICKTNRYKVLGNAWTVPVIVHLLQFMKSH